MSWLFGVIGPGVNDLEAAQCRLIHTPPLHLFIKECRYYIAAGGLAQTCLAARHKGGLPETFALALGCMFTHENSRRELCTESAWAHAAFENTEALRALDGHFVRLVYKNERCEITTDRLGLRTLYWAQSARGATVISSRLDWISRYLKTARIDFEKFGSRWLLYNPLTYDAPLEGIKRLGPSGVLRIGAHGVEHASFSYYAPSFDERVSVHDIAEKLRGALVPLLSDNMQISLGLSGGLDSRVLLSLLLDSSASAGSIHVHTFGNARDPDVRISRRISEAEGLSHRICDAAVPAHSDVHALAADYLSQTHLAEAASTVVRLANYSMLDPARFMMIDGGFGEVVRRQYLSRLALKGQSVIANGDTDAIFKSLCHNRGHFFIDDVERSMRRGAVKEIESTLRAMPDIAALGMGNYLDLWSVRTRVPNFTCDEQSRLDSIIVNDMPFARGEVFDDIFSIPVNKRNNGALLRLIIKQHCPRLQKYPLVKNDATHPYSLSAHPAQVWTTVKKKLGFSYRDAMLHDFLHGMKEYALDTLHSQETVEYGPYAYGKMKRNVLAYYGGQSALAMEVNWWLSFDVWRKAIVEDY